GRAAGEHFIEALGLFSHQANIGDAKSLAIHPATTTHSQLDDAELDLAGVSQDMVRLSVGIRHIDDILADIDQALEAATASRPRPACRESRAMRGRREGAMPEGIAPTEDDASRRFAARRRPWTFILKDLLRAAGRPAPRGWPRGRCRRRARPGRGSRRRRG